MNIFHKVTLESMKKSRTRTLVTIIGVILSAALITGVVTFSVSLLDYLTRGASVKYGDFHVSFLNVNDSFVQERMCDKEVSHAITFENIGYAPLKGSKNPDKPYLFVAGFNEEAFETLPINVLSGRLPKSSDEILVSCSVSANAGVKVKVGDTLSLNVGERMNGDQKLGQEAPYTSGSETLLPQETRNYKVVGICQRPSFEPYTAPGYTLITWVDQNEKAETCSLLLTLKNPHKVHDYAARIANGNAYVFNDNVLRFMGLSEDNLFNGLLYSVGGVVVTIIMVGSVFLIYNSFNISLNERTQQFGILASVGATAKQLRNSVLFEGICIGIVGIPIGVLVGVVSIDFVIMAVAKNFRNIMYNGVPLTLTISIPAIMCAAVISMATILISAYIPARKAARTPVMECIRQTNEVKVESKAVRTSKLSQHLYGLEGTLALKNFKRNKKRYRSIVLSLILSIVLFIAANAFVTNLKQVSNEAMQVTSYDIGFASKDMDDDEMVQLYNKLKTVEGVYESSYQALMRVSGIVKSSDLSSSYWEEADRDVKTDLDQIPMDVESDKEEQAARETVALPMNLQFLDDDAYLKIIKELGLNPEEYMGHNGKLIAVAKLNSQDEQVKGVNDLKDLFTSTFMKFTIVPKMGDESESKQEKDIEAICVNIVPPDTLPILEKTEQQPFFFSVLAPYSLKEEFELFGKSVAMKGLTFRSQNASRSTDEMKNIIEGEGITDEYNLYNTAQLMDESRNYIFIVNVFAYTFIVFITLIAVANVFNTISTNIKLRRRELAMLRSVGMSDHDFQKMMNFECAFYGMRALIWGIPIALLTSWLIYVGMEGGEIADVHFVWPWGSIVISIIGVLLIVFVTMLYAISKVKKENIIDALRDDLA